MDAALERVGPYGLPSLLCLRCGEPLDLHQPAADLPERLIGACSSCCDGCGSWHILNSVPGHDHIVIVLLPPCDTFLDAFSSAAGLVGSRKLPDKAALSLDGPMAPED
jgi:hypothetical protein